MKAVAISGAWAEVGVLLGLGNLAQARAAALIAVKNVPLRNSMNISSALVIGHPALPVGWCFMEPSRGWAILAHEVWSQHGGGLSMFDFADQVVGLKQPAFMAYDLVDWQLQDDLGMVEAGLDPSFWYPDRQIF